MSNSTLVKFGFPESLIARYEEWVVLLRPAQVTLGSLVLGATGEARSLSQLPPQGFAELATITRHVEQGLAAFRAFDRLNYLMLMMVDPHVHFHIIPRYKAPQDFRGMTFIDKGWPGVPDLASVAPLGTGEQTALRDALIAVWPGN